MSGFLPQLPRKTPDKAYEEIKEHLETDGQLDPEKVKELAQEWDWLYRNYEAILNSELQNQFSKVGTHASWVVAAVQENAYETFMEEVKEIVEIVEAGGFEGKTIPESIRYYFNYDEWKEEKENNGP